MIESSSLDLILGIVALVIVIAGLVMLFQGVNTMNK